MGPICGRDPELVGYQFAAAKQQVNELHPDAQVFNAAKDLDTEPYLELALACNFDPADPADRVRLLFSELMDSSAIYLMADWRDDKLCERLYLSAKEVGIEVYEL